VRTAEVLRLQPHVTTTGTRSLAKVDSILILFAMSMSFFKQFISTLYSTHQTHISLVANLEVFLSERLLFCNISSCFVMLEWSFKVHINTYCFLANILSTISCKICEYCFLANILSTISCKI
ncbi:hypothetical protein STEG23_010807, partial [Scotinomys teguina]